MPLVEKKHTSSMDWVLDLEKINLCSDEELNRIKLVIDTELLERSKISTSAQIASLEDAFKGTLCSEPEIKGGVLYAYGAKKKNSLNNHICKFVVINNTWAWESPNLISTENRYSNTDSKLQTLALLQISEGDSVDVIESKAGLSGHRAKNITSYVVKDGKLFKVKSRKISIESRADF